MQALENSFNVKLSSLGDNTTDFQEHTQCSLCRCGYNIHVLNQYYDAMQLLCNK